MTPAHGFSGFFRRPQPIKPKSGEESVWDYPRPPRVESRPERVIVRLGGQVIADTTDTVRVLETSHPPVYYLPLDSFPAGAPVAVEGTAFCEFKGEAHYFDAVAGGVIVLPGPQCREVALVAIVWSVEGSESARPLQSADGSVPELPRTTSRKSLDVAKRDASHSFWDPKSVSQNGIPTGSPEQIPLTPCGLKASPSPLHKLSRKNVDGFRGRRINPPVRTRIRGTHHGQFNRN
jgi:uncharacterized protein (DUF427 family)